MVPAAKLLLCVLETHVFRVFCVPASNADDLDTRQGSNRPESARIVSNCLDLHTFCPFLTVFGRKREADQPDVLSGLGVCGIFGRACGNLFEGFTTASRCCRLDLEPSRRFD